MYRKNLDGNLAALAAYEREEDSRQEWEEMQIQIDDAILECEGREMTKSDIGYIYGDEELAEIISDIKAHRKANKRGSFNDWQTDDLAFIHLFGYME
jgi:hypothetical protein